jgi:Ca-activated chloride channel family protein
MSRTYRRTSKQSANTVVIVLIGLAVGLLGVCAACWLVSAQLFNAVVPTTPQPGTELTVAYSPEKAEMFKTLVNDFNAQKFQSPDGTRLSVSTVELDPDAMIQAAMAGQVQAISPDSSIWLGQLDRAWTDAHGSETGLVGQTVRYAVSPVVIAMWRDTAQAMGYPGKQLGWSDLLAKAQSDPNFRWSHPSTASASGLLATLAEFYAGAGKTRGLSSDDVLAQHTLDYVGAIERTVRYYGEGEWPTMQRLVQEGHGYLDALVCSEQLVIWARSKGADLVAIYPLEGALWQDHPLALLEQPGLTDVQRLTFARFAEFVASHDEQQKILLMGYRPADLSIPLDQAGSPIRADNGVDPSQPMTSLQVPAPAVLQTVQQSWWLTKRRTNVILVVDTSGSMQGEKLANVKQALQTFIQQIPTDEERVGLVAFSSNVYLDIQPETLKVGRDRLLETIDGLQSRGDTALLDAVDTAYNDLQAMNDTERINAIVVMTDGLENNSRTTLNRLTNQMRNGNNTGVPVIVFAIAYGGDADKGMLTTLAESTGGQMREGTLETIRELYKILSTYF